MIEYVSFIPISDIDVEVINNLKEMRNLSAKLALEIDLVLSKKNEVFMLEHQLRQLLINFRYQSSKLWVSEEKKLMNHHIDGLIKDLLPFIEEKIDKAIENYAINGI